MIRQLDRQLINKIAAGEVVERPLSVVKELTENAIDAGAGAITAEIKEGGLSSIRVTDNGCGIPHDQIMLAFAQHATSKISDIDDLARIGTLGFRGEALASIASVSHVEMVTKTPGTLSGTRVELHGGTMVAKQDIGCTEGTSILVSNLFYNTPARLKFLKKPAQEAGYVTDLLQRLALGYPNIAFRYISNGQTLISTNGNGDQKMVIYNIYGKDTARGLLSVEGNDMVSGFIGRPETARSSRSSLNFFINGRYIKSELLQNAIEEAYSGRLPVGRFPVCVLHLNIPPGQVDVNVHPAKLEVRFADERGVYQTVSEAASKALAARELIPAAKPRRPVRVPVHVDVRADEAEPEPLPQISLSFAEVPEDHIDSAKPHDFSLIAQIFNTYWLAVRDDELFLIDQHAAHERILYEEGLRELKNKEPQPQQLLEPIDLKLELNLSPGELATVTEYKHVLEEEFGFKFEGDALIAVPMMLVSAMANSAFFIELLDKLGNMDSPLNQITRIREEIAMAACKAAIKAKDAISPAEARALINRMLALENPYTCPHGRPTMVKLTRREIERMFLRT